MDNSDIHQLNLEIFADDATEADVDHITRQLLSELRELNVESVKLARGELAPEGSKGDPVTIGAIAMAVLPAALPSVIGLVQDWISRGKGRTVKFKSEDFEFEGSPEDFRRLLEKHGGRKKKRKTRRK